MALPVGGARFEHRLDDWDVAGTSAQMTGQKVADRLLARCRVFTEEMVERHQDARGSEAALQRVIAPERRLQNAQTARSRREPFDRSNRAAVGLHR